MRNLIILAGALGVLACSAAFAANTDDPAYGTIAPAIDNAAAAGMWAAETAGPPTMRVMGLLSDSEVQAMRDAHAAAGLELDSLSIVPAGGVNAGKFYVSGTLQPELLAAMEAAHEMAGIRLDLRAMPVEPFGVVMGDTRVRIEETGEREYSDDVEVDVDVQGGNQYSTEYQHGPGSLAPWPDSPLYEYKGGDWHGAPGAYGPHGKGEWRGHGGRRWHGGRGPNYDVRDHCGHWEQDWHQDGCGTVHVHNLADWLPNHAGWGYGFPYGGWDDDFWPHVRGDGSQVWYTGEFWRTANIVKTAPAWYDAQWAIFGDAYPDTFWLSTWQGHGWNWRGHGAWGGSCGCRGKCGGGKCGCGCHGGWR